MPDEASGASQISTGTGDITLISFTMRADATLITYPQKLLDMAKGLIDAGEFSIAVVVAHIACEVATDRAFTKAFAAKGLDYLEESIGAYFSGTVQARGSRPGGQTSGQGVRLCSWFLDGDEKPKTKSGPETNDRLHLDGGHASGSHHRNPDA